jgi:DNA-binding MarR family transcriptional regulator
VPAHRRPPTHDLSDLRLQLRRVMRGMWARRRPTSELAELVEGEPPLGRRHVGMLAQVAAHEGQSVGELAQGLGVSLPAASKLATDLESHLLVRRREHDDDRRRTVVELHAQTADRVRAWIERRNQPLERALATLSAAERAAFLKGLAALGDALMEESPHGPLRSHHRKAARRGPDHDRSV